MNEIICPNCQNAFKVDQAGYAAIVQQIRDGEFKLTRNNPTMKEKFDEHKG